jgi:hypothetical protein
MLYMHCTALFKKKRAKIPVFLEKSTGIFGRFFIKRAGIFGHFFLKSAVQVEGWHQKIPI